MSVIRSGFPRQAYRRSVGCTFDGGRSGLCFAVVSFDQAPAKIGAGGSPLTRFAMRLKF